MVRQYRFLLREAYPDTVEVAHAEALARLDETQRQLILSAVQRGLVTGQRLSPCDTDQIAHLIVAGERRSPNAFLTACDSSTLLDLSSTVIHSQACSGLFDRYAAWDGADPERAEDRSGAGFNPDSGRWNTAHTGHENTGGQSLRRGWGRLVAESPSSPSSPFARPTQSSLLRVLTAESWVQSSTCGTTTT